MNLKEFSQIGNALFGISDNIVVKADKGCGVASPQMKFMSTQVTVSVEGQVLKGSVGMELISYTESEEMDVVSHISAEPDENGIFVIKYKFDSISLAVYKNAVSFQINIVSERDESEFIVVSADTLEEEDTTVHMAETPDITKKTDDGKVVVPVKQFDGSVTEVDAVPGKVLFIGNSLLLGMKNTYGMCSTAPDKDYAYRVSEYIRKLNPDCTFAKVHGSGFEHSENIQMYEDWMYNAPNVYTNMPACKSFDKDLDLIFIQLADNINTDKKRATFLTTGDLLMEYIKQNCPKARVIWVYGWYGTTFVFDKIIELADKWQFETLFIGAHNVVENQSYSGMEYFNPETGGKDIVKDTWITHPGDLGMEKIAMEMVKKLGI